jgi:hypothetical protein
MSQYKAAGLTEINISCDDYHQEFIPLERVKYAHDACKDIGLTVLLGHKVMKDCKITIEYLNEFFGTKLHIFDPIKKDKDSEVVMTGYTVPVSIDMHLIPDEQIEYPPPSERCWQMPCRSVLTRTIITPQKELAICCGMIPTKRVKDIVFGDLNSYSLEELIIRAQSDLLVNWLALEGPCGIMRFIKKKAPKIKFRRQYVSICHLCCELLSRSDCREVLHEHAHEKLTSLWMKRTLYDWFRDPVHQTEVAGACREVTCTLGSQ